MEYRLYIFLINYRYLQNVYKKDLDIQFENIKQLISHELKPFGCEMTESDGKSITFKAGADNSFKNIFRMASDAEGVVLRLRSLLKEFEGELFIKLGIITLEEADKRHALKWSFNYDEIKALPEILLTDKTAFSIIENFDVSFTGLKNIWVTKGIEISRAQRIRKLYFNRDEENSVEDFIVKESDEQILFVYGDIGSGKSCLVSEAVKRTENSSIIFLKEKKHSTREFKVLHELMYNLLFVNRYKDISSVDEVITGVQNSSLPAINKDNLTCLIRMLFGENPDAKNIVFYYGDYRTSLKTALDDCLKITQRKAVVIIDDHQWMSRNCEEMLLGLFENAEKKLRLILISDDKNNSNNINIPVKFLKISEINKVQISKLLQMAYPHTKISGKTADFIHKVTEGNLYTVISYIQYLIDKDAITVSDGKVELKPAGELSVPDNLSEIYAEKLNSLSENAMTILKILSIIGEQFYHSDLDWLLHTLNYPNDEATALNELEEKGIITNNGDFYVINEPSVTNGVYKTVKESNRKLIHRLLSELFETKGYEDFGFKVFFHSYRAEDYEKLMPILPELISTAHSRLNFSALRNMLEISDKLLFRLCMKDNLFPAELWLKNLISTKWLFDKNDSAEHIKRFEKAVEYLAKIEKKELSASVYEILIGFYIECGKFKKAESALTSGIQIAEELNLKENLYSLLILKAVNLIKTGRTVESVTEFEKAEELRKSAGIAEESDSYIFVSAMVLDHKGEVKPSLDLLKGLLNKYSAELNFGKISPILKLLIELSIKARDYKAAEDYCKFMLSSGKEQKDENNSTTGNILLARLYSYQNKFLQSISILESVAVSVKNPVLYFDSMYLLGSIYQFFGETDMAEKTLVKALERVKDTKSDTYVRFSFKLALLYAFTEDFEHSELMIKKCRTSVMKEPELLQTILDYRHNVTDDQALEKILENVYAAVSEQNADLLFETALVLLKILYSKRKYQICRDLSDKLSDMAGSVEDYNLTLDFFKFNKTLMKNSSKTRKTVSGKTKVSPSVRKRVKNRRSN